LDEFNADKGLTLLLFEKDLYSLQESKFSKTRKGSSAGTCGGDDLWEDDLGIPEPQLCFNNQKMVNFVLSTVAEEESAALGTASAIMNLNKLFTHMSQKQ
jgi:hypothetical protein